MHIMLHPAQPAVLGNSLASHTWRWQVYNLLDAHKVPGFRRWYWYSLSMFYYFFVLYWGRAFETDSEPFKLQMNEGKSNFYLFCGFDRNRGIPIPDLYPHPHPPSVVITLTDSSTWCWSPETVIACPRRNTAPSHTHRRRLSSLSLTVCPLNYTCFTILIILTTRTSKSEKPQRI